MRDYNSGVYQSSDYYPSRGLAAEAIDGKLAEETTGDRYCTHTDPDVPGTQWWRIIFRGPVLINEIILHNRWPGCCDHRLSTAIIYVIPLLTADGEPASKIKCNKAGDMKGMLSKSIRCLDGPLTGVALQIENNYMVGICEIYIKGLKISA